MEERRALTRRQMVRRLGVGAGVAWAAPAIVSTHVAAAAGTKVCATCEDLADAGSGSPPAQFQCEPSRPECVCVETLDAGPQCLTPVGSTPITTGPELDECAAGGGHVIDARCFGPGVFICAQPCPVP